MYLIGAKHLISVVLQNKKTFSVGKMREVWILQWDFSKQIGKYIKNPEFLACGFLERKMDIQSEHTIRICSEERQSGKKCQNLNNFLLCQTNWIIVSF